MRLETSWLGGVESPKEAVFQFEHGLPGFEHLRQFALIDMESELDIQLLQSLEHKDISFLVGSPFQFYPGYEFELPEPVAGVGSRWTKWSRYSVHSHGAQ